MAETKHITWYNFLVVLTVALGSFTFGFTVNVTGAVLAFPSFYSYFNLDLTQTTGIIGAIPACYFGGGIIGAILGSKACGIFGRRQALFISCIVGILGGVFLAAAVHISMILVGRALSGLCAGAFQTIVPIYQSEISPAARRGQLVGQHGFMLVVGGATAVWIGLACSFIPQPQAQWRLALGLSGLSPLVLAPCIFWLPESPRWLIARDRFEEALRVLEKLHHAPNDPNETFAKEEYIQIRQQLELEANKNTSFWAALKEAPMRKRFLIAFFTQRFFLQCSGVLVTITYLTILFQNLGVSSTLSIVLLGIYNTWSAIGNWVNAKIVDRFGRVRLLFWGLLTSILALTLYTVMVARYAGTTNRVGQGFGVFFVYLYTTFYALTLDVTSYVYCAEIFPMHMRASGMAVAIVGYFAPALLFGELAPTAFATIGWKYYLVFIIVPACGLPIIYKYWPETKGLPLEEMAELFGETVAIDLTHMDDMKRKYLDSETSKTNTHELVAGTDKPITQQIEQKDKAHNR